MSRCTDLHERGGRMIEGTPHRMDQQAEQRPRVNVLAVLESAMDVILDSSYRADGHHHHHHSNSRREQEQQQEQQQATRAGRNTTDATVSSNEGGEEEDYSSSSSSSVVFVPASSTTSPSRRTARRGLPHSSPNRGPTN
jgi:hypothetical protein